MIKAIGITFLFVSSVGLGVYSSYKTGACLKTLREMMDLMNYTKKQIEFFNSPINDIYSSFDTNDKVFIEFIYDVSEWGWNTALERSKGIFLPEKTVRLLKEYGSYLGKSNKEEQLLHSDYYIGMIESEYREFEKKAPERKKLSLSLGLYGGLMLVILFM